MRFLKLLAANAAGWVVFTVLEWGSEISTSYDALLEIYAFLAGIFFSIIYTVIHCVKNKGHRGSAKTILKDMGIWLGVSVAISVLIVTLVVNDLWLVKQATGGWENFLNGIEYFIFSIFWTLEPPVMVWLYYGIRALIFYRLNKSNVTEKKYNN